MEFRRVWVLRGPNVWARFPVLEAELDLGGREPAAVPGLRERLAARLPEAAEALAEEGEGLPDVLRHLALRLQVLAGSPVDFGRVKDTGRAGLYLGRRRNAFIDGLSLEDSNALLDEIWSQATRQSLTWRHQWHVGDLVLWDNRCTMHRRDAFDPAARRVMHRTQIKGERTIQG